MTSSSTTILVAVDFSTGSRSALQQAGRIAVRQNAKLHVLHVIDSNAIAAIADSRAEPFESASKVAVEGGRKALETWLAQTPMPPDHEVTLVVGHPLHEILEHAKYLHADLLVAGITGAGDSPAGSGSVSAKLARKSPANVLLVRAGQDAAFAKIVACIDFSTHSPQVAEVARDFAFDEGSDVDFLHVWADPGAMLPMMVPFGEAGLSMPETAVPAREEQTAQLHRLLHQQVLEHAPGISARESLHEDRNVGRGIADHAETTGADLIVIGALGHSNLHYLFLGSTAERVLTRVPCSLLVVKPKAA